MYQYNNYAYLSGVPGHQNVAAYSTRQSAAAAAAAASYNPFMSTVLVADDSVARRVDKTAVNRDLTSPSCRRPMSGGTSSYLDHSSADVVPPPPSTSTQKQLTSPAGRSAHLSNSPIPAGVPDGALYSSPVGGVGVRVDGGDTDDDVRQQHARSHSAPAATHRRPAATDHRCTAPPNCMWYVQPTSASDKTNEAQRRLLASPPPPLSASTPAPLDSSTNLRHRRTFPTSDVELNGPVADVCETDVASQTNRRPNSVNIPPASTSCASYEPVLTRRRWRAAKGRLNLYSTGDFSLASSLAGMAIVAAVALVFSVVGVQLLLRLTATSRRSSTAHDDAMSQTTNIDDSLLPSTKSQSGDSSRTTITRTVVEEVAIALIAVTVALDLCCLLTVTMQCFFAVKLTNCRNAEQRVFSYLERCSVTRTAASAGLFLSAPVFLLALMLYAVLEYSFTPAIICVVVFTVGIIYMIVVVAHSIHCWNVERSQVNSETTGKSPPLVLPQDISKQTVNSDDSNVTQLKLSTLV